MSNYYENELSGFRRAGQNIATALTRKPKLDAMAREEYFKNLAMAQHTGAATRKLTLEGDQQAGQLAAAQKLSDALMGSVQRVPGGYILKDESIPVILSQLPHMSQNASDFGGGFEKVLGAQNKPIADERKNEADLSRALAVAKLKNEAGFSLSPGGARFSPDGKLIVQQPSAAMSRDVDTVTEVYPPNPGEPAIPGKKHWFKPDEPDIPAVPASPKRIIKRRLQAGENLTSALTRGMEEDDTDGDGTDTEASAAISTDMPAAPTKIPPGHVNFLLKNPTPEVIDDFEAKYGLGSASQYLNK